MVETPSSPIKLADGLSGNPSFVVGTFITHSVVIEEKCVVYGKHEVLVNGCNPETFTVHQFYECKWPYQCSITIYQLAKLHMLEFYYSFLDRYLDLCDFELIQMETNSLYMASQASRLTTLSNPN